MRNWQRKKRDFRPAFGIFSEHALEYFHHRKRLALFGYERVLFGGALGFGFVEISRLLKYAEGNDFLSEIPFVELFSRYDFVGILKVGQSEFHGKEVLRDVGVFEFRTDPRMRVADDGKVVERDVLFG